MAKKLTKKQVQAYVKAGGIRCPYCKSKYLTGGEVKVVGTSHGETVERVVQCSDCDAEWNEVYSLTGIQEEWIPI